MPPEEHNEPPLFDSVSASWSTAVVGACRLELASWKAWSELQERSPADRRETVTP